MIFESKAKTLEYLTAKLENAKILPLVRFNQEEWASFSEDFTDKIKRTIGCDKPLIVRSSAVNEDQQSGSNAGKYLSIADVNIEKDLNLAVEKVFASYGSPHPNNQVFCQSYIQSTSMSGVAFTCDPNTGSPYYVINYQSDGGSASAVTSGRTKNTCLFYHFKSAALPDDVRLAKLIKLLKELECISNSNALDIEFAFDLEGELFLLQARPLKAPETNKPLEEEMVKALERIFDHISSNSCPQPHIGGENVIYGIMPDWNPAEIIGVRPRPLSLTLYKELITDQIWAYQRDNYGYKNLRSFPLLYSFAGLPYIDARVSFNSFIPAAVPPELSDQLVNFYINTLKKSPASHDKIEFDIVISCYTFDLQTRFKVLQQNGFTLEDLEIFEKELRSLTNGIIAENGLWKKDVDKIKVLEEKQKNIMGSDLDKVAKIFWLLEDCKRYGTLPFAGLARAGFVAVQLLQSMVSEEIMTENEYQRFMQSLQTTGHILTRDFINYGKDEFLEKYGHLRPGTFDIRSPRYDQEPERYFNWNSKNSEPATETEPFALSIKQLKLIESYIKEHKLNLDVLGLFDFIRDGIEGREYSKFVFTRSLSDALELFCSLLNENGFGREDASFAEIDCIRKLYSSCEDVQFLLSENIKKGKKNYELTTALCLPPLISSPEDVWSFHFPPNEPNFITLKNVSGEVVLAEESTKDFTGKIVFLPSADPGYDWIFSRKLAGFVTMYGGANSHMAIRAIELGIPAVIGVGEAMYQKWVQAKKVEIDCVNKILGFIE